VQALVLTQKGKLEFVSNFILPPTEKDLVRVKIKAAALNHRDVWITKGLYPGIEFPCVLGSDGAGLFDGKAVILQPGSGWGNNPAFPSRAYQILGMPKNGTLAEFVDVAPHQIYDKPDHLDWHEAAALPLAGLTAFRAVFSKGNLQPGQKVLITGIGGGVALFAMQFAIASGAKVWVSSGSTEKIEKAKAMGAEGGTLYTQPDFWQSLQQQVDGFDLVVDGTGGTQIAHILKICNPGAKVVLYGGGQGNIPSISPQLLFWKQLSVLGTSMGTDAEFAKMLQLVNKFKIRPVVDSKFSFSKGLEAIDYMAKAQQFGKITLQPE
jgi:zinc-binding alcohol dehydrogenase/oxidoreductase